MVLVHGGGGTAFEEWVQLWVSRGYAAIAMDTCGYTGRQGQRERHALGGPEGWGGFDQIDEPVEDQWPYHAVADVILAHSLIRSFPEVDKERIGITGISWGGYLTCIVAGVDHRFKLAVPVYGCGFLGRNSVWIDLFSDMGDEKAAIWLDQWDPSRFLGEVTMPIMWVTGTNDFAFPLDSLQESYRLVKGRRTLCIRLRMLHGHGGPGEKPLEIHVFANSLLKGEPPLAHIVEQNRRGQEARITFDCVVPITKAELCFTTERGKWQDRTWDTIEADLDSEGKRAKAELPEGTAVYYFNLTDERGCIVSSEHEELRQSG
jgi:dienelactone hydrolase